MGWMVRANKPGVPTNALVASVLVSTYTKWEREMCCLSHLCLLRHKRLHGAPVTIGFSTSLVALLLVFAFLTVLFWQDQRQVTCIRTSAEQEGDNSWWNGGQRLRGRAGALWNSLHEYGCPFDPSTLKIFRALTAVPTGKRSYWFRYSSGTNSLSFEENLQRAISLSTVPSVCWRSLTCFQLPQFPKLLF